MSKRGSEDYEKDASSGEPESKRLRIEKSETDQPEEKLKDWPTNWPTDIGGPVFLRPPDNDWIGKTPQRGELDSYIQAKYQYATTSEPETKLAPKAIVYVANDGDIRTIINWARNNKKSIAIRSGGHQYMGFSSTSRENVQLDLSGKLFHNVGEATYPYKTFEYDKEKNLLRLGAGLDMTPVNDGLMELGLTVPHGECMDVHMGGHCQTGGYSPLGRTHGLLVDYIREIELITADGKKAKKIARDTKDPEERDIFYSTIGGSPGNMGVVTHVTIEPIKDAEYPKSRGYKASYPYKKNLYRDLLQICADWADNEELSQYYTLSLCVISDEHGGDPPGADTNMNPEHKFADGAPVAAILVWASYSGRENDTYDPSVFQKVKDAVKDHDPFHIKRAIAWFERTFLKPDGAFENFWGYDDDEVMPLSQIVQSWKWTYPREFNMPFVKRNMMCPVGKNISKSGWVEWTVDWTDRALNTTGIKVGAQFIPFSNPSGGFRNGNDGKTSEAWRNSSMFAAYDLFYNSTSNKEVLEDVNKLQAETDEKIFGGENSFFGEDRRLIWAPFGTAVTLDDKDVRSKFYDSDDVYNRILKTKLKIDEHGVFSPNPFCVGYTKQKGNGSG